MKRLLAALLTFFALLALTGCGGSSSDGPHLLLYYPAPSGGSPGGDAIVSRSVDWAANSALPTEQQVRRVVSLLLEDSADGSLESPIPASTRLLACQVSAGAAWVDFSSAYGQLSGMELTIADYCVTLSLSQIVGIYSVRITVNGTELIYRDSNIFLAGDVLMTSSVYGTTLADIQAKGELVIGLDDTFAPMGFRDESGNLVGFDIDLATAVCEELGVKATFQPIDWDAKEMELSSGNIDCIWNGMSITPEREEAMSLSQAYLNNKIVIMTKEGVAVSAKEDLANYNIGIQAGSAALEAVTNDAVYASIQDKITEYPTYDEVILDVQAGRLDCMIIDEVYGGYKNAKLGSIFAVSEVDFGDDLYAIGFRKGDAELTQAVNDAINALIESGKAAEISEAWFGADIVVKG